MAPLISHNFEIYLELLEVDRKKRLAYRIHRMEHVQFVRQRSTHVMFIRTGCIHATIIEKPGILYGNNFQIVEDVDFTSMSLLACLHDSTTTDGNDICVAYARVVQAALERDDSTLHMKCLRWLCDDHMLRLIHENPLWFRDLIRVWRARLTNTFRGPYICSFSPANATCLDIKEHIYEHHAQSPMSTSGGLN
jgi:hypothetical protein